jgi:hypothetical protein
MAAAAQAAAPAPAPHATARCAALPVEGAPRQFTGTPVSLDFDGPIFGRC